MLRFTDFIIDCPDTMTLAAFYSEVTARPVKAGSDENWAGIQFDEIELAFNRPATSKLTTADALWAIQTLGFRGEALPAIAAIA